MLKANLFSAQASRYPSKAKLVRLILGQPAFGVGGLCQSQALPDVDKVRMANVVYLTQTFAVLADVPAHTAPPYVTFYTIDMNEKARVPYKTQYQFLT